MRSIYRWEGVIQNEAETPMVLKTTTLAVNRLGELILKYHPYETPCVVALATTPPFCNSKYVSWARSEIE